MTQLRSTHVPPKPQPRHAKMSRCLLLYSSVRALPALPMNHKSGSPVPCRAGELKPEKKKKKKTAWGGREKGPIRESGPSVFFWVWGKESLFLGRDFDGGWGGLRVEREVRPFLGFPRSRSWGRGCRGGEWEEGKRKREIGNRKLESQLGLGENG